MDKFSKKVHKDLIEGEEVLAYVKAAPKGFLEGAIMSSAVYATVGALAAGTDLGKNAREKGEAERKAADLDLGNHNQVIVGITAKRLLIWSTKVFGSPKKLLGAIDLKDVKEIEKGNSKLFVANMPTVKITMKNDNFFELQVGKIFAKKIERLIIEFNNLK